jgi:transcriptional regulator with XRE-family HTH domain
VGKLIVYYRELKGWGQKQLLYATGLTQSRLSSLERGTRRPRWDELDRIAYCLEQPLTVFSLLRRHAPQQPPAGTEPTMPGL